MAARVGIDYLPAVCHTPGVGRYARELVRALVRLPETPQLELWEVGRGERILGERALGLEGARVRRLRSRAPRRLIALLHRLTGLGADSLLGGVDLFHRAFPADPPVRRALELLPLAELPKRGSRADERMAAAVGRVDDVLVFCDDYQEQVAARYGLAPERVHQAPVGCDHWLRDLPTERPERPREPVFLALGALREERHPLALLAAFELVREERPARLVFAGRRGTESVELEQRLRGSRVRDWVRWEQDVTESDLPTIVAGASTLVHLSDDEGSAVTPLEAFALGPSVVCSRLPAFEQALGAEAEFVETAAASEDPGLLAAALLRGLERASGDGAAARRRAIAARHTWEANARRTLEVWSQMLAR